MTEIIIYTKSHCPYCIKAKQLFKMKNVHFKEIDITDNDVLREEMLAISSGKKTVPQIFIGKQHIGGCDDLYALNDQGKLDPLLIVLK
jgi:glutaredoxin 3